MAMELNLIQHGNTVRVNGDYFHALLTSHLVDELGMCSPEVDNAHRKELQSISKHLTDEAKNQKAD